MPRVSPPPQVWSTYRGQQELPRWALHPRTSPAILSLQPYCPERSNYFCRLHAGKKRTMKTSQHRRSSWASVTIVPCRLCIHPDRADRRSLRGWSHSSGLLVQGGPLGKRPICLGLNWRRQLKFQPPAGRHLMKYLEFKGVGDSSLLRGLVLWEKEHMLWGRDVGSDASCVTYQECGWEQVTASISGEWCPLRLLPVESLPTLILS